MTKKILVVEDDPTLRSILQDSLANEDFVVLEAKDGNEALALALSEHPDLIMLDIILPGEDGLSVLKKIHADEWGKTAKVIILTNLSDSKSLADSLELGSYDYLVKSDWKIKDVMKVVHNKLGG